MAYTIVDEKKEMGVPEVGMSEEGVFAARSSSCEFQDVKFKNPIFKHEIFVRIDMKHSYFSNYFIICLQLNCLLFASCFGYVRVIVVTLFVCLSLCVSLFFLEKAPFS